MAAQVADVPDFKDPNFPLRIFTNNDVERINKALEKSRPDRVREALFPETIKKKEVIPSTQIDPEVPTAIQTLSEPCLQLRDAIEDIINYQQDADFAAKFIPEIVRLLGDPDKDVVRNAADLTRDLTGSEAASTVATKSPQLVSALIRAANAAPGDTKNELLIKAGVAAAMLNLSKYEQGRLTLFKTGGIVLLVKLLGSPADRVVNFAISTLHNLLTYQEGAKNAVKLAGGIQKMVPLLKYKDQRLLAVGIDCLFLLAYQDPDSKLAIWNCGGPKDVVAVFKNKQADDQLVRVSSKLLRVLSTCPNNKEKIVEFGGFAALVDRLDQQRDEKLFISYLTTLRNLSDADTHFRCDDSLISYLLQFLKWDDEEVVVYMTGVLANLSAEKPRIKQSIYRTGGLELFLDLVNNSYNEDIREPALCVLRHLTSKHQMCDQVQRDFREMRGLEVAMRVFHMAGTWPIVKASTGLIRNLVNAEENHHTLVDLKVIPRLGQILALAVKEEKQSQNSLKRDQSLTEGMRNLKLGRHLVDGVDLDDVIESAIAAMAILGHASMINKDAIIELSVTPLLLRLEESTETSVNVASACRSLLEELNVSTQPRRSLTSMDRRSSSLQMDRLPSRSSSRYMVNNDGSMTVSSSFDWKPESAQPSPYTANDPVFFQQQPPDTGYYANVGSPTPNYNQAFNATNQKDIPYADHDDAPHEAIYANASAAMGVNTGGNDTFETVVDEQSLRSGSVSDLQVRQEATFDDESKDKKKKKKAKKEKKEKKEKKKKKEKLEEPA